MARFYGAVGYGETIESPANSGIWVDVITEYLYFGDVTRASRKNGDNEHLNSDITVSNTISIIVDQHAAKHFSKIKYVEWNDVKWTVDNVEVQPPRLILRLGSVYNGPTYIPPSAP